tara:strand:+ start:397 stop:576 length:180 start_codon:yes stop_codon:yes gene_type:complete
MKINPIITKELVDKLKGLYPNQLPHHLGVQEIQVAFLQGQQSIILKLETMLEDDQPDEN